jgi:hypothetical protein
MRCLGLRRRFFGLPDREQCAWGNVAQNSSNDAGPVKPVDGYDASFE